MKAYWFQASYRHFTDLQLQETCSATMELFEACAGDAHHTVTLRHAKRSIAEGVDVNFRFV
jgi:hypothetical protein